MKLIEMTEEELQKVLKVWMERFTDVCAWSNTKRQQEIADLSARVAEIDARLTGLITGLKSGYPPEKKP